MQVGRVASPVWSSDKLRNRSKLNAIVKYETTLDAPRARNGYPSRAEVRSATRPVSDEEPGLVAEVIRRSLGCSVAGTRSG